MGVDNLVVIEVLGGVAYVTHQPSNIEVKIIDWDNINDEESSNNDPITII